MQSTFATFSDYASFGFGGPLMGGSSPEELGNLMKALAVGADRDPPATFNPGDGFAFRVEDLDPLLRTTTYTMKNIVLWKLLQKMGAENTVVEYNLQDSYGVDGFDGFIQDGGLPEQMDSTYRRAYAFVKFIGIQGAITHGSTMVRSAHGNLVSIETQAKTMKLLELVERSLYVGDSTLDPVQWDGFFTQMRASAAAATNIKDKRGQPLTVEDFDDAGALVTAEPNYGLLTDVFMNPLSKADMVKGLLPGNRGMQGLLSNAGAVGGTFDRVATSVGDILTHTDAFISHGRAAVAAGLGDAARRPGTPTLTTAATSPVNAASLFIASDTGNYIYQVVARNRFGSSVPLTLAALSVTAGDDGRFGITPAPGQPTAWFEIFRTPVNGAVGTARLILRVANTLGFAETTVIDLNAELPGTTSAIAFQWDPTVAWFRQLAPLLKIALGVVDLNLRWAQVLYGVPILGIPTKTFMWKNIGRLRDTATT